MHLPILISLTTLLGSALAQPPTLNWLGTSRIIHAETPVIHTYKIVPTTLITLTKRNISPQITGGAVEGLRRPDADASRYAAMKGVHDAAEETSVVHKHPTPTTLATSFTTLTKRAIPAQITADTFEDREKEERGIPVHTAADTFEDRENEERGIPAQITSEGIEHREKRAPAKEGIPGLDYLVDALVFDNDHDPNEELMAAQDNWVMMICGMDCYGEGLKMPEPKRPHGT